MWWMRHDFSSWDMFTRVCLGIIVSWFIGQFFVHLKSKEDTGAWCGLYFVGAFLFISLFFDHAATAVSVK